MPDMSEKDDAWFVYDGECPLCRHGANNFCLSDPAATLHRINQRSDDHEVVRQIREQRLDLDRGMVIKYRGHFYQGADALHLMSRLGLSKGRAGRAATLLFRSRRMARLCYPFLRAARNVLLRVKGIGPIRNLK